MFGEELFTDYIYDKAKGGEISILYTVDQSRYFVFPEECLR